MAVRQNIKMLAPHFPPSLVPRFVDQQVRDSRASFRKPSSSPVSRCDVAVPPQCLEHACMQMQAREEIKALLSC